MGNEYLKIDQSAVIVLPVVIYNTAKITKKAKYGNNWNIHQRFILIFLKDLYTKRNINNTNILTEEIFTTDMMKLFTNEVGTGSDFYNVKITKNMQSNNSS